MKIRAHDLKHVLSVQNQGFVCEISFDSEIVSFGDLSFEPAASAALVVLNNPAQEFANELANKLILLQNLDIFRLRTGINTSMQRIQDEYRLKLESNKKGKDSVQQLIYARFGPWEKFEETENRRCW